MTLKNGLKQTEFKKQILNFKLCLQTHSLCLNFN